MPKRLSRCIVCGEYSISEEKCPLCNGKLESAYPAKFSIEDKFQKYRMPYFKEKMARKYGIHELKEK